jgi:2-(1,2-epoxy-1,2-dihydrophenyl)acetyl-CoA isomerase
VTSVVRYVPPGQVIIAVVYFADAERRHMDVTDANGVRRVTFDRPTASNAMDGDVARDLAAAVEGVDPDGHDAVLLTGEGDAFSAGGDIEAMAEREQRPEAARERLATTFGRAFEAIYTSRVPVVARVDGDAAGAGLSVVAVSDFAFAAASARFVAAFVHVGLVPDTGGTFLLPRLVGWRTAKRLAITGEAMSAAAAEETGLVNATVPGDELDDRVEDLLATLRDRPTETVGQIKRAMHENLGREWGPALDYEQHVQALAYGGAPHEEGVAAFLEDREPDSE